MYIRKILAAVSVVVLLILGVFTYFIYSAIFSPNTSFDKDSVEVLIPTNADFNKVQEIVNPYIEDMSTFQTLASKKGYTNHIKAGRFILKKGMNNNEIINTLRSKNMPIKLRFNNQERLADLAGRIGGQIEADSISLYQSFTNPQFLSENGFTEKEALGMYIPNTYEFFWNTSADEFRDRMLKEYKRFWSEERLQKAKKQNLSPKEVMVLASIVQKETAQTSERPTVAGLYLNRLKSGRLLQADPTVIYAIKEHTGNYDTIIKRVLIRDTELDSPYNTYKYAGLPPAPITMPDISSIDAVLNPQNHDYFYMVADPDNFGYHKFARTLMQHNRNREGYIKWLQKKGIRR